ATKLGQKDGLAVVGVCLDLLVPSRLLKVRRVAPRVVVKGEEVTALIVGTAVEVLGLFHNVLGNIGGRVADRNSTAVSVGDVLLHVTGDGLNIGGRVRVVLCVDDLVSGKEEEQVVVFSECV